MDHTDSEMDSGVHAPADTTGDRSTVKSVTQDVTKDAQRRGQEVMSKAADEAQQFTGELRAQATGALGEGKTQLALQIGSVARALRASGGQFRKDQLGDLADLSDSLAGQVEAVQNYLSEQSGEALLGDFRTFAARHRGLFVGSLLVAGLLAARFVRSGAPQAPNSDRGAAAPADAAFLVSRGKIKTYPADRP